MPDIENLTSLLGEGRGGAHPVKVFTGMLSP